jgi:putative flippase GtrA
MMAVAFADGRPSVFYDSHSYDVMGRNLIQVVQEFPASVRFKMKPGVKWGDAPVTTDRQIDAAVEGARSPFYGVLLHGAWMIGTLWLLAAIQGLLAAWVAYLLWRTLAPKAPSWSFPALTAGVVVGTSLPFFTAFAMPDVFAGIGGGAVVLLLSQTDRLKRWEIVGLWLLSLYSFAIHKSHLATGFCVTAIGVGLLILMGARRAQVIARGAMILGAIVLAWLSAVAFGAAYQARTGLELAHPPFLMARVLADGPGRDYLHSACAKNPNAYAVCHFSRNLNQYSTENLILWSDRPNRGVFNIADRATRVRLEHEEPAFVMGVIAHEPIDQTLAALVNWGRQLVLVQVDDPLRNPAAYLVGRYWPTTSLPKLIPNFEGCRPPHSCRPPFSRDGLAWWHGGVLVLSLAFLLWRLTWRDMRGAFSRKALRDEDGPGRILLATVLILTVVLINAAVCGILSGPFARYQARVIWLAPLAAGLLACALPLRVSVLVDGVRRLFGFANGQWNRLRLQPVIGRFLPPLDGHLVRFGMVGALGFVVDGGVLKLMIFLGMDAIAGRAVSFPVAVLSTWLANRTFTFTDRVEQSKLREASTYVAVQLVGGLANFAVYSFLVHTVAMFMDRPLAALAFGAVAGMAINYLGSKHIVFGRRPASP